jgi:hypothetical protein
MGSSDKTVHIMGIKFLKCQQENCEWNVGWLEGTNWTQERGAGTRIFNLEAKAMIEADAFPPHHCLLPAEVLDTVLAEFEF